MPLEELIVRHALGEDVRASGGRAGRPGDDDSDSARRAVRIGLRRGARDRRAGRMEDVIITAKEGQRLVPPPEGASYLGFIFARADSPEEVEAALRRSHAELRFEIATVLATFSPSS